MAAGVRNFANVCFALSNFCADLNQICTEVASLVVCSDEPVQELHSYLLYQSEAMLS